MSSSKQDRARILAIVTLVALSPAGCTGELTARVERLEKLAGIENTEPSPDGEAAADHADTGPRKSACLTDIRPALATLDFLARLDGLMASYRPVLPEVVDAGDRFRCVTEAQASADPELKKARRKAKSETRKSERARQQAADEFRRRGFEVAYTWAKDLSGYTVPEKMGCTDGIGTWRLDLTYSQCMFLGAFWRAKTTRPAYPNGELPELMRRMQAENVALPEVLHCIVDQIAANGEIVCQRGEQVRLAVLFAKEDVQLGSALLAIRKGDLIALKNIVELRKAGHNEPWTTGRLSPQDVTVVEKSSCCPTGT